MIAATATPPSVRVFTTPEVCRVSSLSRSLINEWRQLGMILPVDGSGGQGGRCLYSELELLIILNLAELSRAGRSRPLMREISARLRTRGLRRLRKDVERGNDTIELIDQQRELVPTFMGELGLSIRMHAKIDLRRSLANLDKAIAWTTFDRVHRKLANQGECDSTGGAEYRRVFEEWNAAGQPADIARFIARRVGI